MHKERRPGSQPRFTKSTGFAGLADGRDTRPAAGEKGKTYPLAEGVRLVRVEVWETSQTKQKGSFCVKMSSPQL
jgi:hypothetical protein